MDIAAVIVHIYNAHHQGNLYFKVHCGFIRPHYNDTNKRTYSQLSIIINLIIYFCHLFELYNLYIHLRLWGDLIMVVHTQPINQVEQRGVYTTKCQWQEMWLWLTMIFVSDNNYFHPMNNLTARIASTSTSCSKDVCDVDSRTTREEIVQNKTCHMQQSTM